MSMTIAMATRTDGRYSVVIEQIGPQSFAVINRDNKEGDDFYRKLVSSLDEAEKDFLAFIGRELYLSGYVYENPDK